MTHTTSPSTAAENPGAGDLEASRLSGSRSQRAFRVLLDTLAHPGTIRSLASVRLPAGVPPALLVPLALADVETDICIVSHDPDDYWGPFLEDVTGARRVDLESASIVVMLDGVEVADLLSVRRGTAASPEAGAKVALACRTLRSDPGGEPAEVDPEEVVLRLTGPGVDGMTHLAVGGVDRRLLVALSDANAGFPAGIDTWLVAADGVVAALPRSTHVELEPIGRDTEEG